MVLRRRDGLDVQTRLAQRNVEARADSRIESSSRPGDKAYYFGNGFSAGAPGGTGVRAVFNTID